MHIAADSVNSFIIFVCTSPGGAVSVADERTETELPSKSKAPDGLSAQSVMLLAVDPRLTAALGREISADEMKTWVGMPESQREKALQRIKALDRYVADGGDLTARQAAMEAGVKLGRFYQMARAWSARRSLESLGTYASATKPRPSLKPHVNNALQAVVRRVVDANAGASIADLARRLGVASGLSPEDVPAQNTLRVIVERELRRRRSAQLAGTELLFDLSASSLHRDDGRPHVAFLMIDGGTGLVLGHAIGLADDSAAGYRAASSDALTRIAAVMHTGAIWSESMQRSQIVPGTDASAISAMSSRIKLEVGGIAPQLTSEDAQGGYIRRHLGLKIGSVRLTPSRTMAAKPAERPAKGTALSAVDAYARMEIAVAEHNETMMAKLDLDGSSTPPGEMVRLLEMLAI